MTKLLDFCFIGDQREHAISSLQQLYPNYSAKRRILKTINALNQFGPQILPASMKEIRYLEHYLPSLGPGESRAFLLHKIYQKGRVYIFDYCPDGGLVAVTKVATNLTSAAGIKHEAIVLNSIHGRTRFQIPKIFSFDTWESGCALRLSVTDENHLSRNKNSGIPEIVLHEIAALRSKNLPNQLPAHDFAGWLALKNQICTKAINEVAVEIRFDQMFEVSAAHQDLGSENVFSSSDAQYSNEFTIIDWEFFSDAAPALTDRVGIWLGARHRAFKSTFGINVDQLAAEFLRDFSHMPGGNQAAVMALLNLADLGIDLAKKLIGLEN